jgi:hypothetical protein
VEFAVNITGVIDEKTNPRSPPDPVTVVLARIFWEPSQIVTPCTLFDPSGNTLPKLVTLISVFGEKVNPSV